MSYVHSLVLIVEKQPLMPFDRFSTYNQLIRVSVDDSNCQSRKLTNDHEDGPLSIQELKLIGSRQSKVNPGMRKSKPSKKGSRIRQTSRILSLNLFLDENNILHLGGRQENADCSYDHCHPVILPSKHPLVKLIICSEHH